MAMVAKELPNILNFQQADEQDITMPFEWRNHPEIRQYVLHKNIDHAYTDRS